MTERVGFDLLLITDPDHKDGLLAPVRRALQAARPTRVAVMLRHKQCAPRELAEVGRALRKLTHDAGALLIVNQRVDVAIAIGADGVHLPQSGFTCKDARALLGSEPLIGVSRHDSGGLRAARFADYATLGPIRAVADKAEPMGADRFGKALISELPTFALGGVGPDDIASLRALGAAGVATIRGIVHQPDPAAALDRWLTILDTVPRTGTT